MAGPGDEIAVGARGRGHLRASHADREQVIGILKAAFVQGRLAKDEFDLRVGQTLAARTYAELSAVTADLPAGLAAAKPPQPARAQGKGRGLRPGLALTVATVVYAGVWPVAFALPVSGPDHDPHAGVALAWMASCFYLIVLFVAGVAILDSWQQKRSGKQLPPGPAPGAGGQASPRPPSASPKDQLLPGDPGHPHTAETARKRLPRPPLPVRGHCVGAG
jgi:Domain of unknown function (DUF1707)